MVVFLAGHGRMQKGVTKTLRPNVTLCWAVPEKHNGHGTLSKALLTGAYKVYQERKSTPTYDEHWLCPDMGIILTNKGESFRSGKWPNDHYLLQPKGTHAVALSGIIDYLLTFTGGQQLVVNWTCCRAPIGEIPIGLCKYEANQFTITPYQTGRAVTKTPGSEFEEKHLCAPGCVTFKCADQGSLLGKPLTWPGKDFKAKDDTSGEFAGMASPKEAKAKFHGESPV